MSAQSETWELKARLAQRGIDATFIEANILRRAQLTLRRWAVGECGTRNGCISRDDETGRPYLESFIQFPGCHNVSNYRVIIADLETGALRRVVDVCEGLGLHHYHQGDPRGCALYVSKKPLTHGNYYNGVACVV